MNRKQLSKMQWKMVRPRPIARRIDEHGVELWQIDDKWLIRSASRDVLELRNTRTDHQFELGTDHVREYMTDAGGPTDGFLILKSQIFMHHREISMEPILPARKQPSTGEAL